MFKVYRKISPANKTMILVGLVLVSFAVSLTYGYNAVLVPLAVAALGVAAHITLTYTRLAIAVGISALQVAAVSFMSLAVGIIYSSYGLPGDYNTVVSSYWILFVIAISWLLAFYWSNGRIWLNLLLSYLFFDATLIVLNTFGVEFVWSLLCSTGVALLYLAVRGVRGRKPVLAPESSLRLNKGSVTSILEDKGYTVTVTEDQNILGIHPTKKPVFVVPLRGKNLTLDKNTILLDDKDVTSSLEYASEKSAAAGKKLKVSKNLLHTVVFMQASDSKNDLMAIDVYAKVRPDRKLNKVFLANSKGLNRFLNISAKNDKKLSKRAAAKLSAAVA